MINQQLLDYINQQIQQKVSRETITSDLLSQGWRAQDIEEGLATISPPVSQNQNSADLVQPQTSTMKIVALSLVGLVLAGGGVYFAAQVFLGNGDTPDMAIVEPEQPAEENESTTPTTPTEQTLEENPMLKATLVFIDNLSTCTPATNIFWTDDSTGIDYSEEILGIINEKCEYVYQMVDPASAETKCTLNESERKALAQHYRDTVTEMITESDLYTFNDKEVQNPGQEAFDAGICVTSVN